MKFFGKCGKGWERGLNGKCKRKKPETIGSLSLKLGGVVAAGLAANELKRRFVLEPALKRARDESLKKMAQKRAAESSMPPNTSDDDSIKTWDPRTDSRVVRGDRKCGKGWESGAGGKCRRKTRSPKKSKTPETPEVIRVRAAERRKDLITQGLLTTGAIGGILAASNLTMSGVGKKLDRESSKEADAKIAEHNRQWDEKAKDIRAQVSESVPGTQDPRLGEEMDRWGEKIARRRMEERLNKSLLEGDLGAKRKRKMAPAPAKKKLRDVMKSKGLSGKSRFKSRKPRKDSSWRYYR